MFPNPSNGEFKIQIGNGLPIAIGMAGGNEYKSDSYRIEVYNVYGEKVNSEKILNPIPITIGILTLNLNLPQGIYYLKIISDKGTAVKKIVIAK